MPPALRGEITAFETISGNDYKITMTVADESGVGNGTSITADSTWVVWQNCKRYVVTSTTCTGCALFSSQVIVQVTDFDTNGSPGLGFTDVLPENAVGLGAFVSGIQSSLQQCVLQYYNDLIESLLENEVQLDTLAPGATIASEIYVRTDTDPDEVYVRAPDGSPVQLNFASAPDQYTNGDAEIWAFGTGITVTKNVTTGEFTVAIPSGVEPKVLGITYLNTDASDSGNDVHVIFDYTDDRGYNNTTADLVLPDIYQIPIVGSPSRSTPWNYTNGGGNVNDKQVGVSAYGGGDGSDLELTINDAAVATTNYLVIVFPNR